MDVICTISATGKGTAEAAVAQLNNDSKHQS